MDSQPSPSEKGVRRASVRTHASLDGEAAVADFPTDSNHIFLELPRSRSPIQRTRSKSLVENRPELCCESYVVANHAVNVKNTFIDDWIPFETGCDSSEQIAFRLAPLFLSDLRDVPEKLSSADVRPWTATSGASTCSSLLEEACSSSLEEDACHHEIYARAASPVPSSCSSLPKTLTRATSRGSTTCCSSTDDACHLDAQPLAANVSPSACASVEVSAGSSIASNGSPTHPILRTSTPSCCDAAACSQLPEIHEGLRSFKVRNTFIHYDNSGESPSGLRRVRSMPHSSFCQWLDADATEEAATAASATPAPLLAMPPPLGGFLPGTAVVVEGLVKAPKFNGVGGVVMFFDEMSARYSVRLLSSSGGGHQMAQIKADNLRCIAVPPPCFVPMVAPLSPAR